MKSAQSMCNAHCLYKRPIFVMVGQMSQMDPRDPQDIQISDFK